MLQAVKSEEIGCLYPIGGMMQKHTKFQKTHHPVRITEVKCDGKIDKNGKCVKCGRYLSKNISHNPSATGSLGYVKEWSNGTVVKTEPFKFY